MRQSILLSGLNSAADDGIVVVEVGLEEFVQWISCISPDFAGRGASRSRPERSGPKLPA
jgi:hypothetical protein